MTFGVIENEVPLLAELITLACESAGHDCLIFKDTAQASRILKSIRVDSIVIDIKLPGLSGLDWLETMTKFCPDLPSRTLLLTDAALTPHEAVRIKRLGAEIVPRPNSLLDVKLVVVERLQMAGSERTGRSQRDAGRETPAARLN